MKRLGTLIAALFLSAGVSAADSYVEGQVIVKFRRGASPSAMGFQSSAVKRFSAGRATARAARFTDQMQDWALISLPAGTSVEEALATLRNNPNIELVAPNARVEALAIPNDSQFSALWNLHNTGQVAGGVAGVADADVDAPEAWDIENGSSNQIIVAVLDSGVDYTHPDLVPNMWVNPGEIAGNGLDDDANGIIDDIHGARFNRNSGPASGDPMDDFFHGTHVAGTIGAATNNGIGVSGVVWNVKLMALKFLNNAGAGDVARGIEGIQYAVAHGAHIINNSWGAALTDPDAIATLEAAVAAATSAGVVVTAAAGNTSNSAQIFYPAGYPEVIAVSGTDNRDGNMMRNFGPHIDLGAPGKDVLSTSINNAYIRSSGTSMATPHISGAAALLKARDPAISSARVQTLLKNSVDIPSGWDDRYGFGRLNIHRALLSMNDAAPPTVTLTAPLDGSFVAGTISMAADAADNVAVTRVQLIVDGVVKSTEGAAPYARDLNTTTLSDGPHRITAVAFDGAGNSSSSSVTVNVVNGDAVPPTVSITSPADGAAISGIVPITADVADNTGIDRVRFLADGVLISSDTTAPYGADLDTTALANGAHELVAKAIDLAGNVSTHTITVTVQNSDSVPPTVSLTNPLDNATVGGTIRLKADAADNLTVTKIWFFVDGVHKSTDATSPYAKDFNTSNVPDGLHTVTARAFDGVGNTAEATININVLNDDPVPPTVLITAPADGATVSGNIAVTADASDNVDVARVRFFVDDVLQEVDGNAPYSFDFNTGAVADGPHELMARAVDVAGNASTHTISVTVQNTDLTAPTVAITAPANGATVSGNVDAAAEADDNLAVTRVLFLFDGVARSTDTTAPYTWSFNALLETEGVHTVTARAFDAAGNNAQHPISIVVSHTPTDFDPPAVAFVTPVNGARVAGVFEISGTATDNNYVHRVELHVDGEPVGTDLTAPYSFFWDAAAAADGPHTLVLKAIDPDDNTGTSAITVVVGSPASALSLFHPLFNPVRGETLSIPLALGQTSHVRARILDRHGAEVVALHDGDMTPGESLTWDGRNGSREIAASGTYLLLLELNGHVQTRKLILRK